MNNIRNISKEKLTLNMLISTICKPISMVISYIYVPIVLNYLGAEKYGIWSTILTILSWISYFDIGIGNGLRNRLTESLSKKDGQSRKLVSSAYAFITFIMIMVAIVLSMMASYVNWNKILGVNYIDEKLSKIVIISILFVAINFILSICKNVLYALQRAANVSVMELMVQILNMGGVLIAMQLYEGNLFIIALVYGFSMVVVNLTTSIIIYGKNREVSPTLKDIDFKIGKGIANLGIQFFLIQICALILFTTDNLIISYLYGATDVTPYNIVNKLFNAVISIYAALITPIWSAVTKAKAEGRFDKLNSILRNLQALMIPFAIGTIVLIYIFRPLTRLWLGQELNYPSAIIGFGGMYALLNIWTNTYGQIANGIGLLKEQMLMALIQAIVNLPLSYFVAEVLGLESAGVLLGTNMSLLISCIWLPIITKKNLKERMSI